MSSGENAIGRFDSAYKSLFSNSSLFYQLIRYFVEEDFVHDLKPEHIRKMEKSSFVSREFLQREADIIYQVTVNERDVYFYILLEFQSTPDKRIPIRLFSYLFLFYEQLMKGSQKGHLPAVFPMVFYNGEKPWNVALNIEDLIHHSVIPKSYIPHGRYFLIDVKKISDSRLEEVHNLVAAMIYFERHNRKEELTQTIAKVEQLLSDTDFEDIKHYLRWVFHISGSRLSEDEVQRLQNISEGKAMLETLGDRLQKEGKEENMKAVILNMKKQNLNNQTIAKYTGYSLQEIKRLLK